MSNERKVSKALLEVWEWKDACYRDVAHLPRKEAIRKLLRNAERAAKALNLKLKPLNRAHSDMVAEPRMEYGKGKRQK